MDNLVDQQVIEEEVQTDGEMDGWMQGFDGQADMMLARVLCGQ